MRRADSEVPMFPKRVLVLAGALALCACAANETARVVQPGTVNAPPPPIVAEGDALLAGTVWAWQATLAKDGARVAPDAPERYTLLFRPGGVAAVRADCNRGSASYALDGDRLSFGPVALTKMMCPPGSRDAEFLRQLGAVATHAWSGNDLLLRLPDGATMRFATTRSPG